MKPTPEATAVRRDTLSRRVARFLYGNRETVRGPLRIGAFLGDSQLHRMFETIGRSYDMQNRLLSAGRDAHWRHILVDLVGREPADTVCDMATGTGDVAIELVRRLPGLSVVGVDYSRGMLCRAGEKIAQRRNSPVRNRIRLVESDIRSTPLESGSADVVTISFALRNLSDRGPALEEFRRVLRPGGRLYIMEFALPGTFPLGTIYRFYFDHVMPLFGNLMSRTDYAYSYLRESVHGFPTPHRFIEEIESAGFTRTHVIPLTFGLANVYCARRPDEAAAEGRSGR
ncbi:ubiquinone/menaquinone biosynthesis methyltransferase [Salinispira pacifica]